MRIRSALLTVGMVAVLLPLSIANAQNLLPNPSFEQGTTSPEGWRLTGGSGQWATDGRTGKRSVSVTGTGSDSNSWECTAWRPEPGRWYLIRYFVRRDPKSSGGTPITGFSTVNRDAWDVPSDGQWHLRQFVCRTPNRPDTVLRFGQWHVSGTVSYDDIAVFPVFSVHKRIGQTVLGDGESIRNGTYRFIANFSGFGSNDSRPLVAHTAGFNTNRWVLGGPMSERWQEEGAWVIYRHAVGFPFASATLRLTIGYYERGELVVEVSKDGKVWREVGRFAPVGEYTVSVPSDLLPADEVWVRLWATGALQVHHYLMEGQLQGNPPDGQGATWYFALTHSLSATGIEVSPLTFTDTALLVRVSNRSSRQRQLTLTTQIQPAAQTKAVKSAPQKLVRVSLKPNQEQVVSVPLPPLGAGEHLITLTVQEGARLVMAAEATVKKPWIEVGGFGYPLANTETLSLWWCEATYKVGRTIPFPTGAVKPVTLSAARNEYEPFQLVLTPKVPLQRLRLRLTAFEPTRPSPSAPRPVWDEVALVEYVPVTIPTDAWGTAGEYPDILVPLWRRQRWTPEGEQPQAVEATVNNLTANRNQPLWLTVFVPKGTPAGTYRATVQLVDAVDATGKPVPMPKTPISIELRVYGFTLPDDTPLRTAYGVHIDNEWHRLRSQDQFRKVWDLYMQVCRRYRISPYTPHAYAPIRWEMRGPAVIIDNGVLRFVIDRWQGRIVTVQGKLSSGDEVTIGGVLPLLEQFEREGVGWEGRGIEWVGTERVRDVQFVHKTDNQVIVDVTAERLTSQPARRRFVATVRLTIEAGKPFFTAQLLRLTNTDTERWRVNSYFHLLPPDRHPSSATNTDKWGAWVFADAKQTFAFGAAGEGFTYNLRINPQGGTHGDVYRTVGRWLEPNETWAPENEPVVYVFVWEASEQSLTEFADSLLRGAVKGRPTATLTVLEQPEPQFRYDFSAFDAAMERYLDEFRFNGFNFCGFGLPQSLGGFPQFSPEWIELYKRLMAPILEHLKQKGWLSKAYCYWIDEPHTPEQYELTKRGMAALKEALPGVRRLLTNYVEKFPSPTFYDFVDLWVPIFNQFDEQRAKERQALGEEVWWYVCTGPKQPYPNNFIDHPAITHRIRYWMAAKWGLDGDLYWSMTYYRGKGWRLRNPYEDGQSETPEGGYWGNGDGRLLYPPVRQPLPENAEPVIAPPIPSVRLALIAEGLEDHCYLWLLRRWRAEAQKVASKTAEGQTALRLADDALASLDRLIRSQIDYEKDPQRLMAERQKVAEALERLAKLLGKEP